MMLDPTFFDRFTMAFSLAVHIVLAVIGMTIPLLIIISEYLGIKRKDKYYLALSSRLTTAFVILFAVGTASGMLVAANLLFLWPYFMVLVGQVAILPVFLEVFAFFMESIFIAIYIFSFKVYGHSYKRVIMMCVVAVGAALSAVFITMLNSFMNTPVGFNISEYISSGIVSVTNPLAVFTAPSVFIEVPHVLATAYFAGSALFLAYFAYRYLRSKNDYEKLYHKKAMMITFAILLVGTVAALVTGVLSIQTLYYIQPEKYAAIELNLVSQSYAPETLFGIYANGTVLYGLQIPNLQSILATGNASGSVPGLNQYPQWTWPPLIIHDMFDLMVLLGVLIGLVLFVIMVNYLRKKDVFGSRNVAKLFILCGAGALILLENGWMVEEFGRQPWIIYNVMTVAQAANQSTTIIPLAIAIVALYIIIIPVTFYVIKRIFAKRPLKDEL